MAEMQRPTFESAEYTRPWAIGGVVVGFILFAAVAMTILLAIYSGVAPKPQPPETFPAPQLKPYSQTDFETYLGVQQEKLRQSGWIDKSAGIAAIPVDEAMKIIAARDGSAFDPLPDQIAGPKGGTP